MRAINIKKASIIRRPLGRCEGFTLVEMLVAMLVLALVLLAVYTIWFGLQRSYAFTDEDMKAQREARAALAEMVEYIRTARKPEPAPSDALDAVIVYADANRLILWTDTDRDAAHDLELVQFRVDSGTRTLFRDESPTGDITFGDGSSTRLVGEWVSNDSTAPLFSYKALNGASLTCPVSEPMYIGEIKIDLLIDIDKFNNPVAHQLSTTVQPRNLRQN